MSAPVTYRQPVSRLWWLKKRTYFLFVMRELSSVFVAWFAVFLMMMVYAIGRGEESYQKFLDWAASPVIVVINVVALAFSLLHTVTWFVLTPQAMVVRGHGPAGAGDEGGHVAGRWVPAATVVRVGGVCRPAGDRLAVRGTHCGVGIHRLVGAPMTKRHFEPIVWLLFSGGGVVASVFLPILIVLFGLAIPLGWVQPDYDHLHAVVSHWLTRWSCWAWSSSCCFTGPTASASPWTTDSSSGG